MPHKHKRKRGDDDTSGFDLAPTSRARPLPAYKVPSVFTSDQDRISNKRRKPNGSKARAKTQDDTPKMFARMMAWQAAGKRPSGLDDGVQKSTKANKQKSERKIAAAGPTSSDSADGVTTTSEPPVQQSKTKPKTKSKSSATATTTLPPLPPKILPGESLSSFSARVDQSLPLTNIPRTNTSNNPNIPADIKPQTRLTKHNRRLQRLVSDWRDTDAKYKEKLQDQQAELEDEEAAAEVDSDDDDNNNNNHKNKNRNKHRSDTSNSGYKTKKQREEEDHLWDSVRLVRLDRKGKKKINSSNKKTAAAAADDPWRQLTKKRKAETRMKNLQDVVHAPPELVRLDRSKLGIFEMALKKKKGEIEIRK